MKSLRSPLLQRWMPCAFRHAVFPPVVGLLALALVAATSAQTPSAAPPLAPDVVANLTRIRDAAAQSDWAWQQLENLTDGIGPRLSGSPQQLAAVARLADTMRALGAQVHLQPVQVPHWVRGEERAQLTAYPGRPPEIAQQLRLVALGGSASTGPQGIERRVVVLHSFDELNTRATEVKGNIVLFAEKFDMRLVAQGRARDAYRQVGPFRNRGPSRAARAGAAAVLVRSLSSADFRLPHAGATDWDQGQEPVPAAALATEDSDLIERLAAQGEVDVHLVLTPRLLPDVASANVIADWPGRELPGEYVVVSGHLDSWDLGTGATDDGVGVMASAAVIQTLASLHLHARRTIRLIAWAEEERVGAGSKAYAASVRDSVRSHCAVIESDLGAGSVLGIRSDLAPHRARDLDPLMALLAPLGAGTLELESGKLGSDIAPIEKMGVAGFEPILDARHYFDYHHSAADTLDKVDPKNLQVQAATLATLAYFLADRDGCLPRGQAEVP